MRLAEVLLTEGVFGHEAPQVAEHGPACEAVAHGVGLVGDLSDEGAALLIGGGDDRALAAGSDDVGGVQGEGAVSVALEGKVGTGEDGAVESMSTSVGAASTMVGATSRRGSREMFGLAAISGSGPPIGPAERDSAGAGDGFYGFASFHVFVEDEGGQRVQVRILHQVADAAAAVLAHLGG